MNMGIIRSVRSREYATNATKENDIQNAMLKYDAQISLECLRNARRFFPLQVSIIEGYSELNAAVLP